jgi:hypothetical protein
VRRNHFFGCKKSFFRLATQAGNKTRTVLIPLINNGVRSCWQSSPSSIANIANRGCLKWVRGIWAAPFKKDHVLFKTGEVMTIRTVVFFCALVGSLATWSAPGYAFSPEAQQMCTGDALRLCSSEIPDISRITACMMRNHANLSTGCRTVMDRDLAQQSRNVASK